MLVRRKIHVSSSRITFFDKLDLKYDVIKMSGVRVSSRKNENSIPGSLFVLCEFRCRVLNLTLYNARLN